jgi:3-deoxy-manno-octulosonate cytidylyltransferase (CMP-KDO synthetase)
MKRILGIIPSRLESSRLPKKPLHEVFGLPLIAHVYKRASMSKMLTDLIVATDSAEIVQLVEAHGGKAMLTDINHKNGTERMAEVIAKYPDYDYYTLINGDEILLNPASIDVSIQTLLDNEYADASILAVPFKRENSASDFKIVCNVKNEVMYISRNDIPSAARNAVEHRLKAYHLMTFKPKTVLDYSQMEKTPLEKIEDHEHLRLLEHGYKIICKVVNDNCISLDMPTDIPIIEAYLKEDDTYKLYAGKL